MAPRIVVLGSLNVDLSVPVPRLPRPGETVLGEALGTAPGGKGANQAAAAARLGAAVSMFGRVGQDAHGDLLLEHLRADGVDVAGVARDAGAPTGAALILVEQPGGQNMIAVAPGANARVDQTDVARAIAVLRPGDLLLLQLELPLAVVLDAARWAEQVGARVLLNAAPAAALPAEALSGLEALVVNDVEAAALFGQAEDAAAVARAALASGVSMAVVTLGAAGAVVAWADQAALVPAFPIQAVDTTGAGDAFVGALAVALSHGLSPERAVRLANAAGAAAATQSGAQPSLPRPADLERLFGLRWPASGGHA